MQSFLALFLFLYKIVIIILAVAVILTISNNNPIENANEAVRANDKAVLEEEMNLIKANLLLDNLGNSNTSIVGKVREELNNQGFTDDELNAIFVESKDEYLQDAKNAGQDIEANKDIGIGTDGEIVNLDLWIFTKNDTNKTISIGIDDGSLGTPGYLDKNLVNGQIQGTVPQYIYIEEQDAFYTVTDMGGAFSQTALVVAPIIPDTVTDMGGTFGNCMNLKTASAIPINVTNMEGTFMGCVSLEKAPVIPASVTNMTNTFMMCNNLNGELIINAEPTQYIDCLSGTSTADNAHLVLKGSSTKLGDIFSTVTNSNSNIELGV